jgi:predicted nucleotidyltransferase
VKTIHDIRRIIHQHQDVLAGEYGVTIVGLFGSYARREQRPGSDIDLLAVPPTTRARYPAISFQGMAGMRDKVTHFYFGGRPGSHLDRREGANPLAQADH